MIHRKGFYRWGLMTMAVLLLASPLWIFQLHTSINPVYPVPCRDAGSTPCSAAVSTTPGARRNNVSTAGDTRARLAVHYPAPDVRGHEANLLQAFAAVKLDDAKRETLHASASRDKASSARDDPEPAGGEEAQGKRVEAKSKERSDFTTAATRVSSRKFDPDSSLKGVQAALGARLLAGSDSCRPLHHLVFLKVHKAASSTVANVIQRYGYNHHLNFVLPQKKINSPYYNYLSRPDEPLRASSIIPLTLRTRPKGWKAGEGKEYNLLWNHAIYDRPTMDLIMPAGTRYVAILREPFQRFVSALAYYRGVSQDSTNPTQDPYPPPKWVLMRQARLAGQNSLKHRQRQKPYKFQPDNPFSRYLHLEPQVKLMDYFRNGQCLDLGMSAKEVVQKARRQQFLARLDRELDLVMITEFFDESLVLLRRLMCWEVKDVLYLPVNGNIRKPQLLFSQADFSRHQQLNQADYDLYHFFRQKFLRTLAAQDINFAQEVQYFKSTLQAVSIYCSESKRKARSQSNERPVDLDVKRPPEVVRKEKTRDLEAKRDLKTTRDIQPEQDPNTERDLEAGQDSKTQQSPKAGPQHDAELNLAATRDLEAARDLLPSADVGTTEEAWTETEGGNADKGLEKNADDVLVIPASPWGAELTVSRNDCFMMQLPETEFLNILMSEAWGKIRQEIDK